MKYVSVESSQIARIGYHLINQEMRVVFRGGKEHAYSRVPPSTVMSVLFAESVGAAFNELVKNGGFAYVEVNSVGQAAMKLEEREPAEPTTPEQFR